MHLPELRLRHILIGSLLAVILIACGWLTYQIGFWNGVSQTETYYVSSKGVIHNQDCLFYRECPDAKNCQYCGGKKAN